MFSRKLFEERTHCLRIEPDNEQLPGKGVRLWAQIRVDTGTGTGRHGCRYAWDKGARSSRHLSSMRYKRVPLLSFFRVESSLIALKQWHSDI